MKTIKLSTYASFILVLVTLCLATSPVYAGVSPKNGNFFVGYTDIIFSCGIDLEMRRVYNSQSSHDSAFGPGWAWRYETYLSLIGDGRIIVHEHGGGDVTSFSPAVPDQDALNEAVNLIAEAAMEAGDVSNPKEIFDYKQELRTDAGRRADEWTKYAEAGLLNSTVYETRNKWSSTERGYQTIVKTAEGFERRRGDGTIESYNNDGQLVHVQDSQHYVEIHYDDRGFVRRLQDDLGNAITISMNESGKITSAESSAGGATYLYNEDGWLVESRDARDSVYKYRYDEYHNMIEIKYSDGTNLEVEYQAAGNYVTRLKDRDGTVNEYYYNYGYDEALLRDENTLIRRITQKGVDGRELRVDRYEYHLRRRDDGSVWTYKIAKNVNGVTTKTTYNECCGQPVSILRGDEETTFQYDSRGNLVRKKTSKEVIETTYGNPDVDKPTRIEYFDATGGHLSKWLEFRYNERGDLVYAKESEGHYVELYYNEKYKIKTMNSSGITVHFRYDGAGQPVEMRSPEKGVVRVTYADNCEIDNVDSPDGSETVSSITSALGRVMEIVQPVGLDLSL